MPIAAIAGVVAASAAVAGTTYGIVAGEEAKDDRQRYEAQVKAAQAAEAAANQAARAKQVEQAKQILPAVAKIGQKLAGVQTTLAKSTTTIVETETSLPLAAVLLIGGAIALVMKR